MERVQTTRNRSLDLLKLIAAYMVVFIHVPFYGAFGQIVSTLANFAVPVFFLVSGYFCYQNDTKHIYKKIKKIGYILIFVSLLYNAMNVSIAYINNGFDGVRHVLSVFKEPIRWVELFLFNRPFSSERLWFLLALIYVYIIQLIVRKCKIGYRAIFILSLLGLFSTLTFGELLSVFDVELEPHYVRNFLLTGYPFFGLGITIRHYKDKICGRDKRLYLILFVCGIVWSLFSTLYAPNVTLCVGSVLMSLALFIISLNASNVQYKLWQIKIFECSLGVYIFHKPVAAICSKVLVAFGLTTNHIWYNTLLPLGVCIATTLVVLILNAFPKLKKRE